MNKNLMRQLSDIRTRYDSRSTKNKDSLKRILDYPEKYGIIIHVRMDDETWVTLPNGVHVMLDKSGKIVKGPARTRGMNIVDLDFDKLKIPKGAKSGASSSGKKSERKAAAAEKAGHKTRKAEPLTVNTPESREVYKRIKSGQNYTAEELRNHPVMKQLDAESAKWDAKFGDTSQINTPERQKMRQKIQDDFLQMGSAKKQPNGQYTFDGKVKKDFEAEVVIGLPASGKSTTIANPDSEKMGAFVFDSDILKESIPEFRQSKGAAANSVHKESKKMLESVFSQFTQGGARNGDNLIIPVIGDDYEKLMKKWIKPLEDAGYNVKVKYKDTDPVQSLNRNIGRAIGTGRIIPSGVALNYGNKPKDVYDRFVAESKGGKKNGRGNSYV